MDKLEVNFLRSLYNKSGGQALKWFNIQVIGNDIGANVATVKNIVKAVSGKGYIQWRGLGGKEVALTIKGADELKKVFK